MRIATRSNQTSNGPGLPAWCRAPAMWFVCGVLGFTLVAGIATIRLAFAGADPAVLAGEDYSQWRDEMRGTGHGD